MAHAQVGQAIPISNFQGTRAVPARNLPNGVAGVNLSFDATTPSMLDTALHFDLTVDFSPDGGATWSFLMGATFDGGARDRNDNLFATYFRQIDFPAATPDGQRQVRATLVNNSGVSLTTTATINTF